jgi:hypothetical protein
VIDEADRDRDADDAIFADAQEVDVERVILDGIKLHVARNDADLVRADCDLEHR